MHGLLFDLAEGRPIFIFALPHLEIFVDFQMFLLMYSAGCLTLGTVRPVYRTGVSLLSRERFLYI